MTVAPECPLTPPATPEPLLWHPRPLTARGAGSGIEWAPPRPEVPGDGQGTLPPSLVVNLAQDFQCFAQGLLWAHRHRMRILLAPDPESASALLRSLSLDAPSLLLSQEASTSATPRLVAFLTPPSSPDPDRKRKNPLPRGQIALWSSGTTQSPGLHFKSWTQLLESADAVGRRLGIRRFSHVLSTVPPYHLYGLEHGLFMPWRAGVSLYRKRLLFPPDIRAAATLGHCALLVTTPFHLRALVESGLTVAGLGLIVCSTAPLSTALARESEKRFKTPVVEVYGSTETGALATRRTVREENWHLLDHVKLARQGKRPCIAWRRQGTTRFLDDEVEALDSTHLRLLGRRQDIVKVAGRRASLAALNEALLGIPGVRSGAFYHPRERETRGEPERLVAFVVAPGLPPESILVQLRQRIDGPFLPRPLVVVEEIPHHPTGKISQATLAGLYREHLAQPHDSAAH